MDDENLGNICSSTNSIISSQFTEDKSSHDIEQLSSKLPLPNFGTELKQCDDECNLSIEPFCNVKLHSIIKLKNSTRQLLGLLEEIQTKTQIRNFTRNNIPAANRSYVSTSPQDIEPTVTDAIGIGALKKLKNHTRKLDYIFVEEEHDDCSIYKRLTRKCQCLNQPDYNDFLIHFNEDSKYTTNNIGEIIKNLRILRKFLYMGGIYTKNALTFLDEGLTDSQHTEKIEIVQGCANADICNIFEDHSIVIFCISWPCKNSYHGDNVTQALAAGLLYKLAQLEEGRRYINYNSKISNDIKKVLRKKSSYLEIDTINNLNASLDLIKPAFTKNMAITYFTKSVYEGVGTRAMTELIQYRQNMTLDEVLIHLDLLYNYSNYEIGKKELMLHFPTLLILFKHLLRDYDNSQLNIIATNILNNILARNVLKNEAETSKGLVLADTATEPIQMKNEICQIPQKKNNTRKINKSKPGLGISPDKLRLLSKRKASEWEKSSFLSKSKKFGKGLNKSIIIVPIEK